MGMPRAFHAGSTSHETPASSGVGGNTDHTLTTVEVKSDHKPRSSSGLGHPPFTRAARIRIPYGVPSKTCSTCSEAKPFEDFNKDRTKRDGHQSLCRECQRGNYGRGANREKALERTKRYKAENPAARKAHRQIEYAIKAGRITRGFCECGAHDTEAHHHRGYSRPLDVQWICRRCHVRLEPRRGVAA